MSRIDFVWQELLPRMKDAGLEDTIENRIYALDCYETAVKELVEQGQLVLTNEDTMIMHTVVLERHGLENRLKSAATEGA